MSTIDSTATTPLLAMFRRAADNPMVVLMTDPCRRAVTRIKSLNSPQIEGFPRSEDGHDYAVFFDFDDHTGDTWVEVEVWADKVVITLTDKITGQEREPIVTTSPTEVVRIIKNHLGRK